MGRIAARDAEGIRAAALCYPPAGAVANPWTDFAEAATGKRFTEAWRWLHSRYP